MADKKITDLTELTEAASDDYLEIVDTSANASKKITRENLIAGHDHDSDYLGISAKAADSDKLDGNDSTAFATSTHSHDHGNLTGLTDDDHTQYVKDAGTVTDNAIVRFDGTDGRTIQNSKVTIDDNGIIKDENSNPYGRPVFLTTPKTSTSWDGDAYSTTAKTKIDLSTVFGVPANVKAVLVRLTARDSGSSAGYCQLALSPNNTAGSVAVQAYLQGVANDVYVSANGIVPCDSGGDIYYQITASGTGTLDAFIEIWGWWL
jgi:hypothetical protein